MADRRFEMKMPTAGIHPFAVMRRADPLSRKRLVGFALLAKNSCRSASDPVVAIHAD
jgi:hypothetical protein